MAPAAVVAGVFVAIALTVGAAPSAAAPSPATNCVPVSSPPAAPAADSFYTPPSPLPVGAPGTVIRSRPVCITAASVATPYQAWQVMYLSSGTEDATGNPSELNALPKVDVATIIVPLTSAATSPRPLVSYQVAEDADSATCSPSYESWSGTESEGIAWPSLLAQGWALVVPDHEGLDSEFAAGVQEGHAVLDGIRAAESFAPAGLTGVRTPVGLWGYSGGGHATSWAAELAPSYAPELNLAGATHGGTAADIKTVWDHLNGLDTSLDFAAAVGVGRAYPNLVDLPSILNPAGMALLQQANNGTCDPSASGTISNYTKCGCNPVDDPKGFPGIAEMIGVNDLRKHTPKVPEYIYHSYNDELIPLSVAQEQVAAYCAGGDRIWFRVDYPSEHISNAYTGAPGAVGYLASRFAGEPAPNTCALPDHGGIVPPGVTPPASTL
jgi:hypothetical protein